MRIAASAFALFFFSLSAISQDHIVISEFRVRGPSGGNDEFVEIYNSTPSAVDISGWMMRGSNSSGFVSTRATVLSGTILMPGQYYLFTNAGSAGYSGSVPGDRTYTTGITDDGGVAITNATLTIIDQVGMSNGSAFKEGTILVNLGSSNQNRSYERKPGGSACNGTDTDNNAADFQLISPSNPQNRNSAFCFSSTFSVSGSANPSTVFAGGTSLLTATVNPGTNPTSTGITVTGDLSSIGGTFAQSFFDDGTNGDVTPNDNTFSFQATVALGTAPGMKSLPIKAQDVEGLSASTVISLTVDAPVQITAIHEIQGSESSSPYTGQVVTTRGVVTGRKSNGFFIQTPDNEVDVEPGTSEGVFVFTSSAPPSTAAIGNLVSVKATVVEFVPSADPFSPPLTELSSSPIVTLISSGNPLPAPVAITSAETSPSGSIEQLERFEGMRVQVNSLTVVGPTLGSISEANATSTSNGVFYGVVTGVARPFREPGIEKPFPVPTTAPSAPIFDANPERLRVDSDGQTGAARIDVTAGATVTNLVGPLDYSFRTYTILPDPASPPSASGNISAVAVSDPTTDDLTVATFNMQRFFDTVNDPNISDVALTAAAFNNRLNKASLATRTMMKTPDIIGVVEVENISTLQSIAAKLNSDAVTAVGSNPGYVAYLEEGNDIGGIDVGFLVKSTRVTVIDVTQEGKATTFINPADGQPDLLNDRPPLVLRAEMQRPNTQPFPLTVIAVHQRSLSGVDDPADGPRVREKRKAQAEFLANLIQARQTANPNENIIAVGDYNAFQFNDGYVDVMGTVIGTPASAGTVATASPDLVNPDLVDLVNLAPADQRYSFVFDGNAQELDHIVVNQPLLPRIAKVEYARTNADFPEVYRNDANRPERLSDHDPAVAYITLPPLNHPPVANAGDDQAVECTGREGTQATLDGSASTDADGDSLVYTWKRNGEVVAGPSGDPSATFSLDLGSYTLELVVDDLHGGTGIDTVIVLVADTTPPVISVVLSPSVLWPPNSKMVDIQATVTARDTCDTDPGVVLVSITLNEAGSGAVEGAEFGAADFAFQLRAARLGTSRAGRLYTVVYRATDESGNSAKDSATVAVPHSLGSEAAGAGEMAIEEIPTEFSVGQNYPNPFNPTTVFRFGLPIAKRVVLKVYNIIGEEVAVLVNGERSAGFHTVEWNAASLPSGMYIYRFVAGDFVETKKLLLVK